MCTAIGLILITVIVVDKILSIVDMIDTMNSSSFDLTKGNQLAKHQKYNY